MLSSRNIKAMFFFSSLEQAMQIDGKEEAPSVRDITKESCERAYEQQTVKFVIATEGIVSGTPLEQASVSATVLTGIKKQLRDAEKDVSRIDHWDGQMRFMANAIKNHERLDRNSHSNYGVSRLLRENGMPFGNNAQNQACMMAANFSYAFIPN